MIEKMKKRDELEDRFVGKNILMLTMGTNILSVSGPEKKFNTIIFNEMQATQITEHFDVIITDGNNRIIINKDIVSEVIIENVSKLKSTLKNLVEGNNIETTDIVEDYDFPSTKKFMVYKTEKKNIKDITTLRIKTNGSMQEKNALDYIPDFKMEITKDKPILFQFASRRDTFEMREMNDIGYRDFEKGCFYGYSELDKAIDDICKHYAQFLENEDEPINKSDNMFEKIKNIFKKN